MPRCDHIAFRVHDLDRTIAFYERVLPARLVSREKHDDFWRTEIACLRPEGQDDFTLVAIMPSRARWLLKLFHLLVPRQMRSFEHAGFACDSVAEVDGRVDLAQRLRLKVTSPPVQRGGKVGYLFEVADPDGNPVEWTHGQVFD